MAKYGFHNVKIEGEKDFPNYSKVIIDGKEVKCKKYVITQCVDEAPTVELELLAFGETEHIAKVRVADMENIAKAMDKEEFEKFCEIWKKLNE
jgi:hypothetical protein